jgi:hypothetical protein
MSSKMPNVASMSRAERKAHFDALREINADNDRTVSAENGRTIGEMLSKPSRKKDAAAAKTQRAEALDRTAATPQQFLRGHSNIPRFFTQKKLPPFEEVREKFQANTSMLFDRAGKRVSHVDAGDRIPYCNASKIGHDGVQKVLEWDRRMRNGEEPRLEAPNGSGWHKLVEAFEHGKLFSIGSDAEPLFVLNAFIGDPPHIFVIEHDWAAAFDGATDVDQGEYFLPYEHCAFEFRILGTRVIMSAIDITDDKGKMDSAMIFIEGADGCWFCSAVGSYHPGDEADPDASTRQFSRLLTHNVRALCIGLDAEVIVREVVRAPLKLNQARERSHKTPLPDHSVVRLANRSRVAPLASTGDEKGSHPRLHFVRGHWRHYTDHKTWIRWHLRGNPDLGFVDKHYRA